MSENQNGVVHSPITTSDAFRDGTDEYQKAQQSMEEDTSADNEAAPSDFSSSEEDVEQLEEEKLVIEKTEENGTKVVRLSNFVIIKDESKENPFITFAPILRNWYVGYAPDQLAYVYLDSVLFSNSEPSDDDIRGVMMFLTGVMCGATVFNAEFTNGIIHLVNEVSSK